MRKFIEVQETRFQLESITCDRCKRIDDDAFQLREYFSFTQNVGYAGVLGDGNRIRLDLCQHCFKEMFESIYHIDGNYILETDSESVQDL